MAAVEINEQYGDETAAIFLNAGYDEVAIHQDLSGKDRFVTAVLH